MRMNLFSQTDATTGSKIEALPLSLTLRPSCGTPGEYTYPTYSKALLRLLETGTDLPSPVLNRFMAKVFVSPKARLLGVNLSDDALTQIGYFID